LKELYDKLKCYEQIILKLDYSNLILLTITINKYFIMAEESANVLAIGKKIL
jgi:hypothetical protein